MVLILFLKYFNPENSRLECFLSLLNGLLFLKGALQGYKVIFITYPTSVLSENKMAHY